jgi:hypothetical protein
MIDTMEDVPWREAFPEYNEDDYPSACLRVARHREGLPQKDLALGSGIQFTEDRLDDLYYDLVKRSESGV